MYIRIFIHTCVYNMYILILEFVCQIKTRVLRDYKNVLVVMI